MPTIISDQGSVALTVRRGGVAAAVNAGAGVSVGVTAKQGGGKASPVQGAAIAVQQRQAAVAVVTPAGAVAQDNPNLAFYPAAGVLSSYVVLCENADGTVRVASADDPTSMQSIVGIGISAANAPGVIVTIARSGPINFNGWAWTPGTPLFVGLEGAITPTPPTSGYLRQIGVATELQEMLVRLDPPITL